MARAAAGIQASQRGAFYKSPRSASCQVEVDERQLRAECSPKSAVCELHQSRIASTITAR